MRWLAGAVILLAVAALFLAMVRTWRTRSRRQAEVVPPGRVPADLGPATARFDGFYVATTIADDPLQRIASGPWGFRGRGGVRTHDRGVVMTLAGADDRFVAWTDVRGADRATAAIDRVVEPGGLVRLRWTATGTAGATDLDSYFRFPAGDAGVLAALRAAGDPGQAGTAPVDPGNPDTTAPAADTAPHTGDEGER